MRVGKFALVLFLLLSIAGCPVDQGKIYVKDGKQYGVTSSPIWHGRWWNYYERGTSYASGEFWTDAIADLQEAIKQRDSDQRRARTYGLHFLDEYFPHRELGVIYYRLGRYPEAISELQTSLGQTGSAKAKFYLNKSRLGQLEQMKGDTAPPRIVVESPQNGFLTRNFTVPIRGYVEDDTYVSSITINGRAEFIELAEPRRSFTREVQLRDGVNTIDITAVDLVGKPARQQLTVTLDRQGPLVSVGPVERLGPITSQRVRLEGTLSDSSGVVRLVLAGRRIQPQPGKDWDFREEVPLPPGMATIPFETEDAAGNVTRDEIPLTPPQDEVPGMQKGALPLLPRWASLAFGTIFSDLSHFGVVPRYAAQSVGTKPVIKFKNPLQTTYYDTVYVEGQVVGTSPITRLTITYRDPAKSADATKSESLLRAKKPRIFFAYNTTLQEGENRFVVEAAEESAQPENTATEAIVVTRKISKVQQREARLNVAVSPLEKKGPVMMLAETAYEFLLEALVTQRRFRLVERVKLENILREQKLAALANEESAVKIGKLAQAEGMLFGSVIETETPTRSLTALVRFVDVESSKILLVKDVYGEDLSPPDVSELMIGLASKVRESLPLVQGAILKTEGKKVFVNLGSNEIKENVKLLIFRCEDDAIGKTASTADDCNADTTVLDEASVEEVSADRSQGVLRQGGTAVKEADKVITK